MVWAVALVLALVILVLLLRRWWPAAQGCLALRAFGRWWPLRVPMASGRWWPLRVPMAFGRWWPLRVPMAFGGRFVCGSLFRPLLSLDFLIELVDGEIQR
ncbi:hypothetical protein [Paenibacillus sp. JSM ZJ436]|uniref:hypothetical protein n=1 Tax=Paenibacillus sp. JSM ZJ436 TaxID=3376190 RepID=UPI0037CC9939